MTVLAPSVEEIPDTARPPTLEQLVDYILEHRKQAQAVS